MDDQQFGVIEIFMCPLALINLMKDRCTGVVPGVQAPLAFIEQLKWTVGSWPNPRYGGSATIGDYKRIVESNVATTCRLGEMFAFDTGLM